MSFRIGQGFDVHRFRAGRRMVLCGVELPSTVGLEGHSDADVALHSVTDAILGAAGEGDIGEHFPPSEDCWKNSDSSVFLARALDLAAAKGLRLVNCDLTLIGERPRISPHRQVLRRGLAVLLGVAEDVVNVKATTTEGLGWTGRGEGLAAMAVVLMDGPA
ncbi:MAG: 2-C-methyl-D-erythritol 2,4-cyclodiphosphate synthase [Thermoanaerobaculales bacterium]|nr:2-C-methyl-D-erythritol 2,4-cyclodiphosphate synthase [Thermoanaerobaculales bacterium]